MGKYFFSVLGVVLCVCSSSMAFGNDNAGYYLGIKGGLNGMATATLDGEKLDWGPGGYGALVFGYDMNMFRAEIEIAGCGVEIDENNDNGGSIERYGAFVNGYFDLENQTIVTPFVGVGMGGLRVEGEIGGDADQDTVFAMQVAAGFGIDLSRYVTLEVSYRRLLKTNLDFDKYDVDGEYADHTGVIAIRVRTAAFLR